MRIRTASFRYEGAERFAGSTATGRTYVFGDEADKNEYSPMETIVASLATCTAMDVIAILNKKRQSIDRYDVEARAEQRTEYPQVLTSVEVVHDVEGPILLESALRHAIELSATKYCPVSAMLSSGATEIHHRFRLKCTGLDKHESEGLVVVTGPFRRPEIVE